MTLISKLLILLVSIGTSGVGCYATYNSLFSSSPQVTDQAFNSSEVLNQSPKDVLDLNNVNKDQSLQINSEFPIIDKSLNDKILIVKNDDGWDWRNAYTDKYLQIDSKLSVLDQKAVISKKYNSLWDEIKNLRNKVNQQKNL